MQTYFARASTERSVLDAHDGGDSGAELRRRYPRLFAPDRWEWAAIDVSFTMRLPSDNLVQSVVGAWRSPRSSFLGAASSDLRSVDSCHQAMR
jgi:hypothetical protein